MDVVCSELVRQGAYMDALKYMEKVGGLVNTICTKLRVKARGRRWWKAWSTPRQSAQ